MACVFAVRVQGLSKLGVSRYNIDRSRETITGARFLLGALAQCRGTRLIEARKLSGYIGFILRVMARVRMQVAAGFVLRAGFCKNRDKQRTHIVRVRRSRFFVLNISIDLINSINWLKDTSIDF